jgi:hypothetical protein
VARLHFVVQAKLIIFVLIIFVMKLMTLLKRYWAKMTTIGFYSLSIKTISSSFIFLVLILFSEKSILEEHFCLFSSVVTKRQKLFDIFRHPNGKWLWIKNKGKSYIHATWSIRDRKFSCKTITNMKNNFLLVNKNKYKLQ